MADADPPEESAQDRPVGRASSAQRKRHRRQQRIAGKAVENMRVTGNAELRVAEETIQNLRQQLDETNVKLLAAEEQAKKARLDMLGERTANRVLRKFEKRQLDDKIKAASAAAVKSECDTLNARVRALEAQVDADTARHLAERAKFAADEAMHLHNAARLRRERDASRGELADLRKRFREEYGRSLFPGRPAGRD